MEILGTAPACQPGNTMRMNVSSGTEVVLLQPAPALPSIQVRAELSARWPIHPCYATLKPAADHQTSLLTKPHLLVWTA